MASESSKERTVSVDLPAELLDWLDERAAAEDLDRETLLLQLLAAYRTTAKLDDGFETDPLVFGPAEIDEQIERALDERLDDTLETEVSNQITEATNSVRKQLGGRIDSVDSDFQAKIEDVRDRVIQVKKETDRKASREHSHEEFQKLERVAGRIEQMERRLDDLRSEYETAVEEQTEAVRDHTERLETIEERLQTIAWVVSDLRDAQESSGGLDAVERIKRAAAQADVERANCENCGNGVTIALLTDPTCPHCDVTVTNVEPASGWFRKPTLLTASQLESGE